MLVGLPCKAALSRSKNSKFLSKWGSNLSRFSYSFIEKKAKIGNNHPKQMPANQ
jgi:hypothetical protein